MKKFNTILLATTTLISLFFFIKWINEVRPRYEWKEEILVCKEDEFMVRQDIDYFKINSCTCKVSLEDYKKREKKEFSIFMTDNSGYVYISSIGCDFDSKDCHIYAQDNACYKKEKVKK